MNSLVLLIMLFFTSSFAMPQQAEQLAPIKSYSTKVGTIRKILLVVAMDSEAKPIIQTLNLRKVPNAFPGLPMVSYVGKYSGLDIFLIENGKDPIHKVQNVGTQAATLTTYLGITRYHPDVIISVGTAGGSSKKNVQIKDIYVSRKIYFYDRRIPTPGYHEYGLGGYSSMNLETITKKFHLKSGIVCSGDSFAHNEADMEQITKLNCDVEEMEAGGVAWVSMLTNTPMFALKGITDHIGADNSVQLTHENLPSVAKKLANKLKEILEYFSGKSIKDLQKSY